MSSADGNDAIPIVVGLAVGITFVVLFSVLAGVSLGNRKPAISTVVFVQGASFPDARNQGIDPKTITVKIGINNTVRWVNQDIIPHGAPIPDGDSVDPDFTKASQEAYGGYNEETSLILPGHSYQYTFTHPARIDYHMVPHPQMKGTVIVLPAFP